MFCDFKNESRPCVEVQNVDQHPVISSTVITFLLAYFETGLFDKVEGSRDHSGVEALNEFLQLLCDG